MKRIIQIVIIQFFCYSNAYSELTIKIDRAKIGALPIMISVSGQSENFPPNKFRDIIENDLYSSGYFNILDSSKVKNNVSNQNTQYALWALAGSNYFLRANLYVENSKEYIRFDLYDIIKKKLMVSYKINLKENSNIRKISHTISNVIFEEITGIKGIFDTKIAYISTEKKDKRKIYKLHVADIDGYNSIAIYKSSKQLMSPTWSPNNDKIAYVSFENHRPEIFVQTLATGERKKINNKNKSSSAPAWSPNGDFMAYTSSVNGNLEIFVHNFLKNSNKRITNSIGIDTEAEWHPNGKKIFFTSDRSGKPHIYIKSIKHGKAKRVTFDGIYNADANISSDGKFLSLVHNNGSGHKIALYSLKDKYLKVISKGKLDEAPSFSPNNKMILFASKKLRKGILVATSNDGRIRKEIELTGEDVREPIWSH
jgi:TolB protein